MNSPGLRERKKQKTRWAIQEHALRLFAEQGYEATTVDQIAAAAEISPSTFFRYFPTKEDLVIEDEYDALLVEGLRSAGSRCRRWRHPQGDDRRAGRHGAGDRRKLLERTRLTLAYRRCGRASLENFTKTVDLRTARPADREPGSARTRRVPEAAGALAGAVGRGTHRG